MSRRSWKDQRAALFAEEGGAFGIETPRERAPRAEAARSADPADDPELPSDIWGDPPPAPAAPVRVRRTAERDIEIWTEPEPDDGPAIDIWADREPTERKPDIWAEPPSEPIRDRGGFARAAGLAAAAPPPMLEEPAVAIAPRKRARKPWFAPREEPLPKDLVGRDLAGAPQRVRPRRRLPLALLAGGIVAALLLVTLRVELLRLQYAAAAVAEEEEALLERIAQAKVRVRELRDPARLQKAATKLGFVRPDRVITVELPPRLPQVAAAPGEAKP